jgi:hypothetical protein
LAPMKRQVILSRKYSCHGWLTITLADLQRTSYASRIRNFKHLLHHRSWMACPPGASDEQNAKLTYLFLAHVCSGLTRTLQPFSVLVVAR